MAFVWCDTETTGLDPELDCVLAVGIIVTDDAFKEVARNEWLVRPEYLPGAIAAMDPFVREMHTRSGLLEKLCSLEPGYATGSHATEQRICEWLTATLGPPSADIKQRPPLAGNTIGFDRAMLSQHMPAVLGHVHYRSLDVSSLKVLAMATIPGAREWNDSHPEAAHTPLSDLEGSIAELAHWRKELARVSP